MKLDNTFSIPVPATQAWPVLLDLERIAPCVPGATITGREGDDFQGKIKVELGPVGLSYNGVIKVVSQDEQAGIAVLEGRGREARGNGTAKATITCCLVENNGATDVFVDTDLAITGKPAQFGRGALADVAGTLIGQFATNLADEITSAARETTNEPATVARLPMAAGRTAETTRTPAEPLDLLAAAGGTRSVRYGAAAVSIVVALLAILRLRRSARRG